MECTSCVGRHLQQRHLRKLLWQTENYCGFDSFCYRKVGVTIKIDLDFFCCNCKNVCEGPPGHTKAIHDLSEVLDRRMLQWDHFNLISAVAPKR